MASVGSSTATDRFIEIRWQPATVATVGLPDIGYPVPFDLVPELLEQGGHIPFAEQLYWLQEYVSDGRIDWQALEPAMLRLAALSSDSDDRESVTVAGDEWFIELGPLDMAKATVTVQRSGQLLAGVQARSDGRLKVAVLRALDATSIRCLIHASTNPNEQGEIGMRASNWEYLLDHASNSASAFYAFQREESYLSYWKDGVGHASDGAVDKYILGQRETPVLCANIAAIQLGVFQRFAPAE